MKFSRWTAISQRRHKISPTQPGSGVTMLSFLGAALHAASNKARTYELSTKSCLQNILETP